MSYACSMREETLAKKFVAGKRTLRASVDGRIILKWIIG
jgi:hypothetical protein